MTDFLGVKWERSATQDYLSHRTYHGVLPSRVRLSSVSVVVPFGAGVAVPRVSSPPSGFVVVSSLTACSGRRWDVLPQRCTVLLSCVGRRGVGAWVAGRLVGLCARLGERYTVGVAGNISVRVVARVGDWLSWHWSGVGGVIVRIPPGVCGVLPVYLLVAVHRLRVSGCQPVWVVIQDSAACGIELLVAWSGSGLLVLPTQPLQTLIAVCLRLMLALQSRGGSGLVDLSVEPI